MHWHYHLCSHPQGPIPQQVRALLGHQRIVVKFSLTEVAYILRSVMTVVHSECIFLTFNSSIFVFHCLFRLLQNIFRTFLKIYKCDTYCWIYKAVSWKEWQPFHGEVFRSRSLN